MINIERIQQRLFYLTLIEILLTFSAVAQDSWNLVKQEAGIKVYTKKEPGSGYKAFKAEMQVSCKIENIVEVLKNTENINNWVVNCKGVKLLKTEDNDQYYYIETSLPLPFENRDMVYHFQYQKINSEQFKVIVTGLPGYIQPRKGIVRMTKTNGYWLLTTIDTNNTQVTYQMHVEPGGLIPAWLANPFIKNVPFSTFKELRNIVQKSK
jgi:carbon monoxide dehydrogenase subunit G